MGAQRPPFFYALKPRPLCRAFNRVLSERECAGDAGNKTAGFALLSSRVAHASGGQPRGCLNPPITHLKTLLYLQTAILLIGDWVLDGDCSSAVDDGGSVNTPLV